MPTKVLRLPCVKDRTGLARSTIYAHMAADSFPHPIQLGPRCVGWLESDIEDWLDARICRSRQGQGGEQ